MNIDKAIETKERYHAYNWRDMKPDESQADTMSIEALKRIKEHRAEFGNIPFIHLPGETKD